jgi:hypothetical protein
MRRRLRTAVLGCAAALACSTLLTGCGSSPITSTALNTTVGPVFARLYALQQQDKGPAGSDRRPDGLAQCSRGAVNPNPSAATSASPAPSFTGAGDDWACIVNFPYPDGHIEPIVYDVTVQATGCFVASGPASVVGPQTFAAADGRKVTNPLFEFDSCLNLH